MLSEMHVGILAIIRVSEIALHCQGHLIDEGVARELQTRVADYYEYIWKLYGGYSIDALFDIVTPCMKAVIFSEFVRPVLRVVSRYVQFLTVSSLSFTRSLCFFPSLFVSMSVCPSVCRLSLFISLYLARSLSLYLPPSLSLSLSISISMSLYISPAISLNLSVHISSTSIFLFSLSISLSPPSLSLSLPDPFLSGLSLSINDKIVST